MDRKPIFDEFAAADGSVRQGWSSLLDGLDEFADKELLQAQREVARLLEDDNVTYTPNPASAISIADEPNGHGPAAGTPTGLVEPQPWRLDPLPLILDDREWAGLEAGLVQRAELLDAIMADLYGARRLLARRLIRQDDFRRRRVSEATRQHKAVAQQRLFLIAADLGRDGSGQWKSSLIRLAPSGGVRHAEPPSYPGHPGNLSPGQPASAHALLPGDAPRPRRCGSWRSRETRGLSC